MSKLTFGAGKPQTRVGQGDIIHRPSSGETSKPHWGFIITADCDIAQDKAGIRLSYLDIITVHDYLEHVWAAEVLRKRQSHTLKDAVTLVTSAAQLIDDQLDPISPSDLLVWLNDTPSEEIVGALQISSKKQKQHRETLEAVELIFNLRGTYTTPLQRLRRIWAIQGMGTKAMRERLEQALNYNQSTDFHLIPEIPGSNPLGYVVLLREVSSVRHEDLHASALDLQISGSDEGYYIAGPSTDNLRYAISQKMAFMFSRIGMSEDYEAQCEVVTQLAIDELSSLHDLAGLANEH